MASAPSNPNNPSRIPYAAPPPDQRSWMDRIMRRGAPEIPVLRLVGAIGTVGPGRSGLTLSGLEPSISRAFGGKGPVVALSINSPGGSPVQSSLISGRIRQLAKDKNKKVIAFVEDVAASGGYWLACAADEIIADSSSIVGSIGVISAGFGFTGLIERIGVERRVHTSGTRKMILDPFSPERDEDVDKLTSLQREIHDVFIALVRERRGDRLPNDGRDVFNGEFWTGSTARDLGLIDGIGHAQPFLKERFGDKARLRVVNPEKPSLRRRLGLGGAFSSSSDVRGLAHAVLDVAEERALWQRFGLS